MASRAHRILRAVGHVWRMVNPWFPMVRDHRDMPVALYRLDHRWREPKGVDGLPLQAFDRIRRNLLRVTRAGMGGPPIVAWLMATVYVLIGLWALRSAPPSTPFRWMYFAMAALFVVFAITYRWRVPKVERGLIVRELLRERRCASCAYDLGSSAAQADGRTVCPECGAAWVMPAAAGDQ